MPKLSKSILTVTVLQVISIVAAYSGKAHQVAHLYREAPHKKPSNPVIETIETLEFIATMSKSTYHSKTITEPLTQAEKRHLALLHITFVTVEEHADKTVFSDPRMFKHMGTAVLNSQKHNEEYLKDLACNYPHIKRLTVTQIKPLSDNALRALSGLRDLDYLQLDCPLATPSLLPQVLPNSLDRLQIADAWPLPAMPQLTTLDINYCRLEKSFISNLRAPKLDHLNVNRVEIVKGALKDVGKFVGLVDVGIYNCKIDSADVADLKSLPYARVQIRAESDYYDSFKLRGDRFYKQHQWEEAIGHYREVAFSQPTVNTHLQIARCYLAMGESQMASKYCNLAYCIEPTNKESQGLRDLIEKQLNCDQ
ncbi:MAG: hypothetical protein IPO31_26065 [Candidatus Obscuribacter sp.]|nr:hypothetical protein [Candidatus Obscuribacter sp.]